PRLRRMSQANASHPARVFRDFDWSTKESWSRRRRVIGRAEWTGDEANPRFLVTSLKPYLNTFFLQTVDFAGNLAKFGATWHYASENRIFALYIAVCAAFVTRFD